MATEAGRTGVACGGDARDEETPARRSRGFVVLLAVTFLAFVDYAALLPVVPLWSASGGAGSAAVGATTGVMMAATVATQLAAPWLFRMLSLRAMVAIGAVLLGAPTPLYLLSADLAPIVAITVVRGVGFAFVVTAGATLVAELAAGGKLSSAASLYGTAAALPNLGALAGGVWAARTWGFGPVFWGAAVACLGGAALALLLPRGHRAAFRLGAVAEVRRIAAPVALFLSTAASFGAATTFLPVAVRSADAASWALLAASVALVAARLGAGAVGDRYGAGRLLPIAVLSCAAGSALLAAALWGAPALLLPGALLLGAGFGACQNDSFVLTVRLLGEGRSGAASTIWNIAYDGGLGLGAAVLGGVIGRAGYAGAFLGLAAGVAAWAIVLAQRSRE
ncbi:MFS family permease [Nocardia transvalensis]|uniref:MFS family permease n=1 Tax=Nocardia transvalensis TaxID=37333 RepID=A0A7W9PGH4_9NOCA|nr:MFS transporter [Nocardia transvalensis]MBB5915475.1 MFS family permease [Nocardia transvalensis]